MLPSLSLDGVQPPFAEQPVDRLNSPHPHHPVVLNYRWRLNRLPLSRPPLRLVAVASPQPPPPPRPRLPSPVTLLMHSPLPCSLLLSGLPPAALLLCLPSPGLPVAVSSMWVMHGNTDPLTAKVSSGAKRQGLVETVRQQPQPPECSPSFSLSVSVRQPSAPPRPPRVGATR